MAVVQGLRNAGVLRGSDLGVSRGRTTVDALLTIGAGAVKARFAVEERRRAPYPNELERLEPRRAELERVASPLLVVPFVSETLAPTLVEAGWSWADAAGNFDLRANGLLLRQRLTTNPPRPARTSLPMGSGSLAVVRTLVLSERSEDIATTALAHQTGVSQPRASQVLHQLGDLGLIERTPQRRWRPDREALIDRFLSEYRGPGGDERYLYSLDPPTAVAVAMAGAAGDSRLVVSADVGPDLIAPWRHPTLVIIYTTSADAGPDQLGLVPARGLGDANVVLRLPHDKSVFPTTPLTATAQGTELALADPLQMIRDLEQLGGADRLEAASRLREWLLNRP